MKWIATIALILWAATALAEAPAEDPVLPNWRLDVGSSFGVWGWDQGPFKIGRATVQAVVNYKIIDLGRGLDLQAGWMTGTVWGNQPTAEIRDSRVWYVSGPSAGLRYGDMVGGNLFVARLGDEGQYGDVTYWAVGINLTLNPAKLLTIAKQAFLGVGSPDKKIPVAWMGATQVSPGIYRRM